MLTVMLADTGQMHTGWLTGVLLEFARGGAEWILWLLLILGVASFVVFFERLFFYQRMKVDAEELRQVLLKTLATRDIESALDALSKHEAMEAKVVAYGLREAERGPEAVLELSRGALGTEKLRYERSLNVLATVGSNAPFVGLFGTVMGVIMAFDQLRGIGDAGADSSSAVMGAIAEALIATGVGLLVAIPAIIFFNVAKATVKGRVSSTQLLVETATALLRPQE